MSLSVIDPIAFRIGGWPVRWYGIIMGLAILVAYSIYTREVRRQQVNEEKALDLIFWSLIWGFLGARTYYVLFRWDYYQGHWDQIIQIWQGGLAIYGGVLAGTLSLYLLARRYFLDSIQMMDIGAPALIMAQSIGRWGNFMNQEAHGGPVTREWLQNLYLPNWLIEQMNIEGIYYHPTFLYESVWNLIGFGVLMGLRQRWRGHRGFMAAAYLVWYGLGRSVIEGMRTDSLYLGPLRVSQWVSLVLLLIGSSFLVYQLFFQKEKITQ